MEPHFWSWIVYHRSGQPVVHMPQAASEQAAFVCHMVHWGGDRQYSSK